MSGVFIAAGNLAAALADLARKKKPTPVDIWFDAEASLLVVEEALHGLFATETPADGAESACAQVDGRLLHAIAVRHSEDAELELRLGDTGVAVRRGGSLARLPATAVNRKAMPTNRKHKGPVAPRLEGRHRAPKGHTWVFSAQVPFKPDPDEP